MTEQRADELLIAAGIKAVLFFSHTEGQWRITRQSNRAVLGTGKALRDALEAAGVHVPPPSQFAAIGSTVVLGEDTVATCRSITMARRTAAALNAYKPNARGY